MSDNKNLKFRWINNRCFSVDREFTFDGEKIYKLYRDYPHALTKEEKELFDQANADLAAYLQKQMCDHDWELVTPEPLHAVQINGPDKTCNVYRCTKCGKIETRED